MLSLTYPVCLDCLRGRHTRIEVEREGPPLALALREHCEHVLHKRVLCELLKVARVLPTCDRLRREREPDQHDRERKRHQR